MEDKQKLATFILCTIINKSKPLTNELKYITINDATIVYTDFEIDNKYLVNFFIKTKRDNYLTVIIPICNIETIE